VHTALTVGLAVAGAIGAWSSTRWVRASHRESSPQPTTPWLWPARPGTNRVLPSSTGGVERPPGARERAARPPGPPARRARPGRRRARPRPRRRRLADRAGSGARPYCVLFAGLLAVSVADLRVGLIPRKLLYPSFALMVVGLLAASALGPTGMPWAPRCSAVPSSSLCSTPCGSSCRAPWASATSASPGGVRRPRLVGIRHPLHRSALRLRGRCRLRHRHRLVRRSGRRTTFPFGPALALGTVVGVLFGPAVVSAWLGTR